MLDLEEQLWLFDKAPFVTPKPYARAGSQRWLQVLVNEAPELLLEALRAPLGLDDRAEISWRSPLASEGYREYRDRVALRRLGVYSLPHRSIGSFWPSGGPKHDAIGKVSDGRLLFLEAKANIPEALSSRTMATPASRRLIEKSLKEARQFYIPGSKADWTGVGYQMANRLAFLYLFRELNALPAHMVFLYFYNCKEVDGPTSPQAWKKTILYLHHRLGLPEEFHPPGLVSVFFDVSRLWQFAEVPPAPEPGKSFEPLWRTRLIETLKG